VDLKAQYQRLKPEIDAAVSRVLESSAFVLGPEVAAFETAFAAYCGVPHAVAVNTGTSALHLALLAAGVGPGDEVITVPLTFVATVAAIEYTGARPVLVDVEPETYTLDVRQLEGAITERTRAIIPVHLYGQMADMVAIQAIARRHNLIVIEDAAQAHGAELNGCRAGSLGDLGCFSFYPGKNLGAYGEGGMVVTANADWAATLRRLRDWGQDGRYNHVLKGFNYRMEGLQGAILGVKLRYLEDWTEARRQRARRYTEMLAGARLLTPREAPGRRHVYHLYAVQVERRDYVQQVLTASGVSSGIHYPQPVHRLAAYADLGLPAGSFPVSEAVAERELSLPLYPELTDEQQAHVVDALLEALA
jgi:dTDP-4-amino-4,6-dideoxygalactose transaminase